MKRAGTETMVARADRRSMDRSGMDAMWKHMPLTVVVTLGILLCSAGQSTGQSDPGADGGLVKAMELEIKIRELSKEAARIASHRAEEAVKKTSLYKRFRATVAEYRPYVAFVEKLKAAALRRRAWLEASTQSESSKAKTALDKSLAELTNAWGELPGKTLGELMDEAKKLETRLETVRTEVDAIVEQFRRRIYEQEMKRRLTELEIEITRDILKEIERSYKRWAA